MAKKESIKWCSIVVSRLVDPFTPPIPLNITGGYLYLRPHNYETYRIRIF